jgi:AraC-like DNA-binding protein
MRIADYSSLTALAIECGYTDQAHFIHDCEKTIGLTPSEIVGALHRQ